LATPLAAALAAAWPDAVIDWAVGAHSRPALAGNPHLDHLLNATGCVRGDLRLAALVRLVAALRRRRYDAAFVPDRSPVLAIAARLAGIPMRVGIDSGGRGRWHTVRVPAPPDRHEADLYLDLARAVGIDPPAPRLVFIPSADDHLAARVAVAARWEDDPPGAAGPRVAVHPGGGVNPGMTLLAKRWPAERFSALVDRMVGERDARPVLLGAPGDREAADAVLSRLSPPARRRTLDLAGTLDLGPTAAVIAACDLYVGNDSGVAHLAAAVGTPVVAIFGPTRPERYGPLPGAGLAVGPPACGMGDRSGMGGSAGVGARPAGLGGEAAAHRRSGRAVDRLRDAVGSAAIEQVAVEAVWAACERLLGGPGGGRTDGGRGEAHVQA